ncbi:major facilitator superfamily domain-containing protein [Zopfochytrium polystomum]|nr:major facilitator superfamily domain-containing protein [Zopfochytrium polystomum]
MYRPFLVTGGARYYYASPLVQLVIVAFVCFLCPGMFNALNGLGGGGQVDQTAADNANTALYTMFAVFGFFSGTIVNTFGIKASLSFGGLGYCVYVASFLSYSHTANDGFVVFAGALLGCCAGLLWGAQGTIMMSYPDEAAKGRYISIFWMIFNLGAVIGALIPLAQNLNNTASSTVSDGTYVGFIVLTFLGAVLAWCLVDAKHVVRDDGSHVILKKHPTVASELLGLWETITSEPFILLLFPMFFSSNWFYTYQFNAINGSYFNTRTRALNNIAYWTAQIVGAGALGWLLDLEIGGKPAAPRPTRARWAWAGMLAFTMVLWGGGWSFQSGFDRDTAIVAADWMSSGYGGPLVLYILYGVYDAAWQTFVYWLMGSLTNSGRKLANYAGFYKGIQSAGAAVMWRLDALKMSFRGEFFSSWFLLVGALVVALPVVLTKVKEHVPEADDIKFSGDDTSDSDTLDVAALESVKVHAK